MSFTTQYAVMVNGVIYCYQPVPWMPAKPAVFDTKLAALGEAAALEQNLRETTGLTPIITVAHRYCSEWRASPRTAARSRRSHPAWSEEDS